MTVIILLLAVGVSAQDSPPDHELERAAGASTSLVQDPTRRVAELEKRLVDYRWDVFNLLLGSLTAILALLAGALGAGLYAFLQRKLAADLKSDLTAHVESETARAAERASVVAMITTLNRITFRYWQRYKTNNVASPTTQGDIRFCIAVARKAEEEAEFVRREHGRALRDRELVHCLEAVNQLLYYQADAASASVATFTPEERRALMEKAEWLRQDGVEVAKRLERTREVKLPDGYVAELLETYAWALLNFGEATERPEAMRIAQESARKLPKRTRELCTKYGFSIPGVV